MKYLNAFLITLIFTTNLKARINAERELKRISRPFGKVVHDVVESVDRAIFKPQKNYNYVRANSFAQINLARGRMGHTQLAAALPDRSALNRRIIVYYPPTGRVIRLRVRDIGPWNSRDPYWMKNRKPLAETEESNSVGVPVPHHLRAGLSLTPQAWYKLGIRRDIAFTGDFNGVVGWRFIQSDRPAPGSTLPERETPFRDD